MQGQRLGEWLCRPTAKPQTKVLVELGLLGVVFSVLYVSECVSPGKQFHSSQLDR